MRTAPDTLLETRACGRFRNENIKPLVGDWVEVEGEAEGATPLITSIDPRRNELIRPQAANLDLLIIVLSPKKPKSDLLLADRLLIAAHRQGIEALVLVNKGDAYPKEGAELVETYSKAGNALLISAETGQGIDRLNTFLKGRTVCLTGQSAVGKSTLLNRISGSSRQQTGGLSRKTDRGRHTTRSVEIFEIPHLEAHVIDTPGFSILAPEKNDPAGLDTLYPEFAPYLGKCRFDSCLHDQEPDCAVKAAVERGEIDCGRYERYLQLLAEQQKLNQVFD